MSADDSTAKMHDLDTTLWVGKRGIDPVVDELATQLEDHDHVKVKFLRAARVSDTTEEIAIELADRADAEVVETRGHTAVFRG